MKPGTIMTLAATLSSYFLLPVITITNMAAMRIYGAGAILVQLNVGN
jgi:hypothetical protein